MDDSDELLNVEDEVVDEDVDENDKDGGGSAVESGGTASPVSRVASGAGGNRLTVCRDSSGEGHVELGAHLRVHQLETPW